jgi:hypothetical protein
MVPEKWETFRPQQIASIQLRLTDGARTRNGDELIGSGGSTGANP